MLSIDLWKCNTVLTRCKDEISAIRMLVFLTTLLEKLGTGSSQRQFIGKTSKVKLVWFSFFAFRFSFFVFRFSFFDIRTESENRILTFKILFWHSNWVGKCDLDIQIPILTFELSRKIVFWHSKSYFDIRTESENAILIFKILFWHSNWVGKSYFDIQNPILTFELSRKICIWTFEILFWHSTKFECQNRIFNIKIRFSD